MNVIAWPVYNGKKLGTVLRSSNWSTPLGIIADQTRSGKYLTRLAHVKKPAVFNITMHMTLSEYRIFKNWYENVCRKGLYPFGYPEIDDNSGVLKAYQFSPDSEIGTNNTGADNLEISMVWMEAL